MNKHIRVTIGIICFLIILIMAIWMIKERDTLFRSEAQIVYPDRCIEEYINSKLVTDECVEGRMLQKKQQEDLYKNFSDLPELDGDWVWEVNLTD